MLLARKAISNNLLLLRGGSRLLATSVSKEGSAAVKESKSGGHGGHGHHGYSFEQALQNVAETKISYLKNGLRIASEDSGIETATVGVWIDTGSRWENAPNNGVAHFLEHMAFKGTAKRSQDFLEVEIENLGAHLNAFTSREQTAFYAKVVKKDIPQAIEILADILQNSTFSQSAIDREREVILREMQEVEKQTDELIFDHLHATAFQGSSLGRTILGPVENIKSITKTDIESFIKQFYTGPRMVIAAAGGVNHEDLVKLSEKAFGNLPAGDQSQKPERAKFVGSEIRLRDDEQQNAHIAFSVEGVSWTNPDFFPLMVTQFVLGSWDRSLGGGKNLSSKLAQVVAQNGLCESYHTFNTCYSDTGLFGFYIVANNKTRLDDVMFQFQNDWARICVNATEAEVNRAKSQLRGSLLMGLDGSTAVCEDIGRQLLTYGRRLSMAEINTRIQAVDAATVRRVAYKYLYDKDPAVVAYGPIEGFPDYNRIQTSTGWLRA